MVGRHSFRRSPEMRFAVGDSRHFVLAQPTPRQNHLLAALPQRECQRLAPDLEPCPLPLAWTIHDAGEGERFQAVALSPRYSYRLRADRLQHEFEHDGPPPRLLLRYTQALIGQIGLISACKQHHTLEQRFCRWLLSCLDRLLADYRHAEVGSRTRPGTTVYAFPQQREVRV